MSHLQGYGQRGHLFLTSAGRYNEERMSTMILRGLARGKETTKGLPMNELRACLSVSGVILLAALFGATSPVHAQDDAAHRKACAQLIHGEPLCCFFSPR